MGTEPRAAGVSWRGKNPGSRGFFVQFFESADEMAGITDVHESQDFFDLEKGKIGPTPFPIFF